MYVSYNILKDSMVISCNGKYYSFNKEDARYPVIFNLIKQGRLEEVSKELELSFNNDAVAIKNGAVYVDNEPVGDTLTDRILQFKKENLPIEYLVKFIRKLRKNPSFNSRMHLYKFLEHNGHPITTEGNFIAYRGISKDHKDLHTGTIDNSPGKVVSIDRSAVDDNPNNTCSYGLHVACFNYAKGFGPVLVEVEVNPEHVVCVPVDYNGTKMRVCSYKVIQEVSQINNKTLETSSFDDDSEYLTEEEMEEENKVYLKIAKSSFIDHAYINWNDNSVCVSIQNREYKSYDIMKLEKWYDLLCDWEAAKSSGQFFNNELRNYFY